MPKSILSLVFLFRHHLFTKTGISSISSCFCTISYIFMSFLNFLFSVIVMAHNTMQIRKYAIFLKYNIAILQRNVKINIDTLDISLIYLLEFLFPYFICNIFFNILPPSSGYIGIKLNNNIKIFE